MLLPLMRKLLSIIAFAAVPLIAQDAPPAEGLRVTYTSGGTTDTLATSHIALYVPQDQSPTPFLPAGKFSAVWEGSVAIDLRGDYSFEAIGSGSLKLEVNNAVLLDLPGRGGLG